MTPGRVQFRNRRPSAFALALLVFLVAQLSGCAASDPTAVAIPSPIVVDLAAGAEGCSLADAIRAANRDTAVGGCPAGSGADTVLLPADGVIELGAPAEPGGAALPSVTTRIAIEGERTTIRRADGAPRFGILHVAPEGRLVLRGIVVSGGSAEAVGDAPAVGGIHSEGELELVESAVRGNEARGRSGVVVGGVYAAKGRLRMIASTVEGNAARCDDGCVAGVRFGGETLELVGVRFEGNASEGIDGADGGALRVERGDARLEGLLFVRNDVRSDDAGGGALAIGTGATVRIVDTVFGDHGATYGGAIFNLGTLELLRSDVRGQADFGGAVYNAGTLRVTASELHGSALRGGALTNLGHAVIEGSELVGCADENAAIDNRGTFEVRSDSRVADGCGAR